ncbi:CidA/LrgA family protein [Dolosicoccus paucivorans]|uniref:CidA/LrgA family protein n=1 Tax=Dolosicoccus paucivorans TaxID=84521 RepID=A0A1G8JXW3_9LACT|nr:CidA/LrgA family protein [Dolosicoccus paucivorans]PMB85017.1 CidA/LrgA family protein [Dolosicoccus paucivorans]PMC59028.1 CidA/LrgA family protein [Dolosicoccus paucivorans]SDI36031.1 holin-like protein [Dolosicoccus paucivorans]
MKLITQLFWILLFVLLGEVVSLIIAPIVLIPGSVIGMILLFLALHFNFIKMEQVEEVGSWLTDNMLVFFIPAGVGLITTFHILGDVWWQLLIAMIVTIALLMGVSGVIVQALTKDKEDQHD